MSERAVRDAFLSEVERYCKLAKASGLRTRGLRVSISVATTQPLRPETVRWMHRAAHKRMDDMLPEAVVHSIVPTVRADLPEQGFRFTFEPPPVPRPRPTIRYPEPVTEPAPSSAPPTPVAVLTLRYDADSGWPYRIAAAHDWLALGRSTGRRADSAMVQLPTYASWLPHGGLLLVRNHDGELIFGRSAQRPEYEIRVDGVAVYPGGAITAHPEGSLEYRNRHSSTLLTYRVDWEGRRV